LQGASLSANVNQSRERANDIFHVCSVEMIEHWKEKPERLVGSTKSDDHIFSMLWLSRIYFVGYAVLFPGPYALNVRIYQKIT